MSSSTGTRRERNVQTRATEALTEIDKNYIASLKVFADSSNDVAGLAGGAVNNSPNTPAGNYLARAGDSMIGPLALGVPPDFRIQVDANNTIDIGPFNNNPFYSSNLQLDDLQPNSSVLDIIAGTAFDGQLLVLRTFAPTVPYTISQGTIGNSGNIQTGTSSDITVGDLQTIVLIFDESLVINANTGGTWRVVSISNPAGGSGNVPNGTTDLDHLEWNGAAWIALQDLTFTNNTGMVQWRNAADNGDVSLVTTLADELKVSPSVTASQSFVVQSNDIVTAANIQSLSLSIGAGTVASTDAIISTTTAKLNIEAAGANRILLDAALGSDLTLTTPAGVTAQSVFNVVSTHVSDPDQSIALGVGSGTAADGLLETSANILKLAVGNISRWQIDINTGNDILQTGFSQTPSYTMFLDGTPPTTPGPLASLFFDADLLNGTQITFASIIANVLDRDNLNPKSSLEFKLTDGTPVDAMALQLDGLIVQNGYVSLPEITTPGIIPSGEVVVYGKDDGGDTKLFYKFGSTEVGPLDAGGSGGANTALSNLIATSINQDLVADVDSLRNLGSVGVFWSIGYIDRVNFGDSDHFIDQSGNDLRIRTATSQRINFDVNIDNQGFFDATGLTLRNDLIVQDDTTLGETVVDSLVINAIVESDITMDDLTRIKAAASDHIGFTVDDSSGTVGSDGTLQIPVTQTSPGTAAVADARFGNFVGAMGFQDTGAGDTALYIRQPNGNWSAVLMTRNSLV